MRRQQLFFGIGLVWLIVCLSVPVIQSTPTLASGGTPNQHQGVPAYFYPNVGKPSNGWYRMCSSMSTTMGGSTAIINPASGPGSSKNSDYVNAVQFCHTHVQLVIGYVHTTYGTRSLSTVEAEVATYYQWYQIDGIFVDEMSNNSSTALYYQSLYQYIHNTGGTGASLVVGNPGVAAASDWQLKQLAADELLIFEGDAKSYTGWSPPSWVANYPAATFWNVVYNVPTVSRMKMVCLHSKTVNAGSMYVTYGTLPNPYNFLPKASYWNSELSAC